MEAKNEVTDAMIQQQADFGIEVEDAINKVIGDAVAKGVHPMVIIQAMLNQSAMFVSCLFIDNGADKEAAVETFGKMAAFAQEGITLSYDAMKEASVDLVGEPV